MSTSNKVNPLVSAPSTKNVIEISATPGAYELHATPNQLMLTGWCLGEAYARGGFRTNTQEILNVMAEKGLIDGTIDLDKGDEGARAWASVFNTIFRQVTTVQSTEACHELPQQAQYVGYGLGSHQVGKSWDELCEAHGFDLDKPATVGDEEYDGHTGQRISTPNKLH